MKKQETPSLTGPSELGTSCPSASSPDILTQDGGSQSLVTVSAFDSNGKPLRNLSLRSQIFVGGTAADFGTLSARSIVTGTDGQATLVYTAPAAPGGPAVDSGTTVNIAVTPIGTDFANSCRDSRPSASCRLASSSRRTACSPCSPSAPGQRRITRTCSSTAARASRRRTIRSSSTRGTSVTADGQRQHDVTCLRPGRDLRREADGNGRVQPQCLDVANGHHRGRQ